MNTVHANRSHNRFVRAAAAIGDLSNPFYREERQRDVWNEASAVALQVLIWLHLIAATAVVWIVGADATPYVYVLIASIGLAGWIAILYSASLGVQVTSRAKTSWRRMVPLLVVVVLLVAGMLRAQLGSVSFEDGWSTVAGMVTGIAFVLALFMAASWFTRRRTPAHDED